MITDQVYAVPCVYDRAAGKNTKQPLRAAVPGSKSITNRALLLATLARGTSTLRGVLFSDDARPSVNCIRAVSYTHLTLPPICSV